MKNIIGVFVMILLFGFVNAWSYPLNYIYPENCEIGNLSCAYELPIIEDAEYEKYRYNRDYRAVYTMLWGTTYFDGRDIGLGGHQGVDFASKLGTPIIAVYSGKIILAEDKGNWGFVVTIEHEWKGKKIYSSYAHLNKILVNVGDIVQEGDLIAELGSSGNSTGPHLHFQIEINTDSNHPFFYKGCPGTIGEIVNEGRCQKQMFENTIDPILFIEKNGNIPFNGELVNSYLLDVIADMDLINSLEISGFLGGIISLHDLPIVEITSSLDIDSYLLDDKILFQSNEEYVDVFPNSVEVVGGKRDIFLVPQKEGISFLNFQYGNNKLAMMPLIIQGYDSIVLNLEPFVLDNPYEKEGWIALLNIESLDLNLEENSFLLSSINISMDEIWDYKIPLKSWFNGESNLQAFSPLQNELLNKKWLLLKGKKIGDEIGNIVLMNGDVVVGELEI